MSTEVQASATPAPTRRERQREATYAEIVRTSRELLADGTELSLRAVAGRMGMTAPALYRYVGSYQELVDLVAFEVDKAATVRFAEAADALPEDDYAGRLVASVTEFRMWALANPREFSLAFANPVADAQCVRRELLTISNSGHLMTGQMRALWEHNHHPIPALEELPPSVRESVLDPLIPAKVDDLAIEDRGLVWLYQQGWTTLYGVVALEVFGHMDPRIIESGEMYVHVVREFAPKLGLADDMDRLEGIIRERLARG
jgi:AcrR family transcriptional regulator